MTTARPCVKHVIIPTCAINGITGQDAANKSSIGRLYPSTASAAVKQDFNWNYKPSLGGRRRRLSTGTAASTAAGLACNDLALTKRRLSQVGEVVSRRFSAATLGWKNLGQLANNKAIVDEAKGLCAQYIRARLRRSSICHRKCMSLQRLRSVMNMTTTYGGSTDTFYYLNILGKELELRHPKTYSSVCRQICRTLNSETVVQDLFLTVANKLIPKEEPVSWGRIVALFAVTGGLAVDCVQQGHVDYVLAVIEFFGIFVETQLTNWISQQGGWNFLVHIMKPAEGRILSMNMKTLFALATIVISLTAAAIFLFHI